MEKELERTEVKSDEKEPVTLEGDAAISLWLEGKDAWNKWMEENPKADVNFSGVDFSYKALRERFPDNENLQRLVEVSKDEDVITFNGYKFSGEAYFNGATFSGEAKFNEATFSGEAYFINATFSGVAYFFDTTFSDKASFIYATFSGTALFRGTQFRGNVSFRDATFSGNASFNLAIFSCHANFFDTTFSVEASFINAIFSGEIDYQNSNFESTFIFEPEPLLTENIESLNFKGAAFEKLFSISGNFNCIPDLRQTKTSHHVDLSNLEVKLNRSKWPFRIGLDNESLEQLKDDAERLCRLKEIAESNKNNEKALAFHADEMRAKRLWNWKSWPKDILDFTYSVTSNYGQSIFKPFIFLVFSILMFAQFTMSQTTADKDPRFKDAVTVSIATVTPFISISKGARDKGLSRLYGENTPDDFDLYSYLHAGLSFIFIFLIGLGLRNRFRI